MLIGFIGLPGAGKGTAAAYLVEKYGASAKRFSTPLRDILSRLYQPITRENMQALGTIVRASYGNDVLAETLLQDLQRDPAPLSVMEGFRYEEEFRIIRSHPGSVFVAIEAPFEVRLQRIQHRGENEGDQQVTAESFAKQHEHETERGIPALMAKCDHRVENTGSVEKLHTQLDALMKKLQP